MTIARINLADLDGSNGFRLDADTYLGNSVSNAGDVNGDGFDDVIVGSSSGYLNNLSYVVFGKASSFNATMNMDDIDGSNGFRLNGESNGRSNFLIDQVSRAGDVNGDGFDDFVITKNQYYDHGSSILGTTSSDGYVVFGKGTGFSAAMDLVSLNGSNGFQINGFPADRNAIIFSMGDAGDINGDGFDDLMIQTLRREDQYSYFDNRSDYIVFGKVAGFDATLNLSSLNGSNGFHLEGDGRSPAGGAGDINGDGFDDFIDGGSVVFGKATFNATLDLSSLDGSNGFRLNGDSIYSTSGAGDVNGDGFDDVIIGAPHADWNGISSGSSYVVFGRASGFDAVMNLSDLDGSNGFRLDGEAAFDYSGFSVSSAGDVNGDGFDDVIIGAPHTDWNGSNSGSSYVVFGKASGFESVMRMSDLDSSNGFRLDGASVNGKWGESGQSVSGAGDVNGDGFDDLIIGSPGARSSYVIFGRSDFTDGEVVVNFPGTPGDDIFTGTKAAESFEGGAGNDRMIGRGGADWFDGGAGNDYIRIADDTFQLVDGGSGTDILGLAGSGFNLDLSSVIDKIHGIETIGLYGVGDNSLALTAQDVIDLSDTTNILKIKGNAGDSVTGLSSGWSDGGIRGNFHEYTQGDAVILVGLAVTTDFPVAVG